jgi:hypothetical protein
MSCVRLARRRRLRAAAVLLAAAVAALAVQGCSPATPFLPEPGTTAGPSGPVPGSTPPSGAPLTAEINQFRDNYAKQIVEIQLTNTTPEALTVLAAELETPLFPAGIAWHGAAAGTETAGTEIPAGQTKSLPAPLSAASCQTAPETAGPERTAATGPAPEPSADAKVTVVVTVRHGAANSQERLPAGDPFGVLERNNAEMCLARDAAEVASFRLEPELEVSADGRTAVVRLDVIPRENAGEAPHRLTVDQIEGTTLLAESPATPWPRGVTVATGGGPVELRLGIRPARCDPHAVAEDKVGTLLPLRVSVGGRQGVLKVDSGAVLRGRIYDFVTAACGPH